MIIPYLIKRLIDYVLHTGRSDRVIPDPESSICGAFRTTKISSHLRKCHARPEPILEDEELLNRPDFARQHDGPLPDPDELSLAHAKVIANASLLVPLRRKYLVDRDQGSSIPR
jgi:hypothetical protein